MRAEIRYLLCPNAPDLDPQKYVPEESDFFRVVIQALVGPIGQKGEESFQFYFCTPKWVEKRIQADNYLLGWGYIIVSNYNYDEVLRIIRRLCELVEGSDWHEVALKLSRYGDWEFQDYNS